MQKITICGNLTADPVLSTREWTVRDTGEILKASVCNFTVAVDSGHGEHKFTQFFGVSVWRNYGETCAKFLKKGYQVLVHGTVKLKNYQDKDGTPRAVMEIRPDEIMFLNNEREIKVEVGDEMPY